MTADSLFRLPNLQRGCFPMMPPQSRMPKVTSSPLCTKVLFLYPTHKHSYPKHRKVTRQPLCSICQKTTTCKHSSSNAKERLHPCQLSSLLLALPVQFWVSWFPSLIPPDAQGRTLFQPGSRVEAPRVLRSGSQLSPDRLPV